MKKKIVFSTYDDLQNPYYGGGGAFAIYEVAKRLVDEYDVTIITGNYPKAKKEEVIDGILYKRIGPGSLGPRRSQLLFHMLLPQYVKKEIFDVWIESFTPPVSTSRLQMFTKKPVIGLAHMLSSEDMERKYKLPFHILENSGLKTYKYFIVLTDAFKQKIEKVNAKAMTFLIPNGVTQVPTFKKTEKNEYILFLGRLELNQKGIDLLIDAYADIESQTKATLIIAGAGLDRDTKHIQNRIKGLGLQHKVILKGKVTGEAKEHLLKNASVVAIPSRFETFSMVALEAMSYGKPIVSFDIQGLQWVPSRSIIRAKSFDASQFGQHVLRVLIDHNLQQDMSSAALTTVQEYSWDLITKRYRDAISIVLQSV